MFCQDNSTDEESRKKVQDADIVRPCCRNVMCGDRTNVKVNGGKLQTI